MRSLPPIFLLAAAVAFASAPVAAQQDAHDHAAHQEHARSHQHEKRCGVNGIAQQSRQMAGLAAFGMQARKLVQRIARQHRQRLGGRMKNIVVVGECHASPQAFKSLSRTRPTRLTRP